MKFLQELNGSVMWLAGCKREIFRRFNHLGLCNSIWSTRKTIDRIRKSHNSQLVNWKTRMSKLSCDHYKDFLLLEPIREVDKDDPADADFKAAEVKSSNGTDDTSSLQSMPDLDTSINTLHDADISFENDTEEMLGFTLTFDNVNQKTKVKHKSSDNQNKMYNMVQAFAAKNRIPSLHLSDVNPSPEDITNIEVASYLPTQTDEDRLKDEMTVIVERILVEHMDIFKHLKQDVVWHMPHMYAEESSQPSELVTLGVLHKDEAKIADMIQILDHYHSYVPRKVDGGPMKILLFGDGLSCERVNDAQNARVDSENDWERLQGTVPAIQEWHCRLMLLEDTFRLLYDVKSAREQGTLYYLRNKFKHRNVKAEVSKCFNEANEFYEFVTTGFILGAALSTIGMSNLCSEDSVPQNLAMLHDTARSIVSMAYESPNSQEVIKSIADGNTYEYCVCKVDLGDVFMAWCENRRCPNGTWFHPECLGLSEEDIDPEKPWFCSPSCKQCIQKTTTKDLNQSIDHKHEYARSVIFRGLLMMCKKDAIKENDGPRIIRHWKFHLFEFLEYNHSKYLKFADRLLTAVSGGVSERLQQELIWCRTVNSRGGKGKNIEKDLKMEFLNRDYKESVKHALGQLTDPTIERHSQMVLFGKQLLQMYDANVCMSGHRDRKTAKLNRDKDLTALVAIVLQEDLFNICPGRHFRSFPNFQHWHGVEQADKLYGRIIKHRNELADQLSKMAD